MENRHAAQENQGGGQPPPGSAQRWIQLTLLASLVMSLVSIFVTLILLTVALAFWVTDCRSSRRLKLALPPYSVFVLAYGSVVCVSILFSSDVLESAIYLKKLVAFFAFIFLIMTYLDRTTVQRALLLMLLVLTFSSWVGMLQYFWFKEVDLLNRITGFMSHWMTFSGQLMLGLAAASGYLLLILTGRFAGKLWRPPSLWGISVRKLEGLAVAGMVLSMGAALILTQTRSTWLGSVIALALVVTFHAFRVGKRARALNSTTLQRVYRFRWVGPLLAGAALVLVFFLLPARYQERLYAGLDTQDYTTAGRLELLRTGRNMIVEHPLTGVGPRMVPKLFHHYKEANRFPFYLYQHLHNNFLQVAAESGLIAFLFWIMIWIRSFFDLFQMARRSEQDDFAFTQSVTGMAAIAAFLTAGLFEYNFGDSEVLILLVFLITSPHVSDLR